MSYSIQILKQINNVVFLNPCHVKYRTSYKTNQSYLGFHYFGYISGVTNTY